MVAFIQSLRKLQERTWWFCLCDAIGKALAAMIPAVAIRALLAGVSREVLPRYRKMDANYRTICSD